MTTASVSALKTADSQVATFRRITQLKLDVSLMAELEKVLDKLRRCAHYVYINYVCTNYFLMVNGED